MRFLAQIRGELRRESGAARDVHGHVNIVIGVPRPSQLA
jgi:hypothetical protein